MRKIRVMAALCAVFLLVLSLSTVAYAGGGEETPEPQPTETPVKQPNPFTPAGTGTGIDNATDGDGKEFYTIMTPNENVFYLIIDRQRETENVYFLNAVTEKDLLALAEQSEEPSENVSVIPPAPVTPEPTPEPAPEPAPEPEKGGGMGMMTVVVLVVLAGGGAAYYFKIYRPKQQQADNEEDYDYSADEADTYGEDAEPEDDSPPWYEDEDERGGDGEA